MNPYIIETRNLTKKYGEQTSVSRLNLHVKKGRIYGLLGRILTWIRFMRSVSVLTRL